MLGIGHIDVSLNIRLDVAQIDSPKKSYIRSHDVIYIFMRVRERKLRKVTMNFATSDVCSSTWSNLALTWRIFVKFDNGGFR